MEVELMEEKKYNLLPYTESLVIDFTRYPLDDIENRKLSLKYYDSVLKYLILNYFHLYQEEYNKIVEGNLENLNLLSDIEFKNLTKNSIIYVTVFGENLTERQMILLDIFSKKFEYINLIVVFKKNVKEKQKKLV